MSKTSEIMFRLYEHNIWDGFQPTEPTSDLQGWNGDHPSLGRIVSSLHDGVVAIDVGVWKGQSTLTIADAMRQSGIDGCVIGVDTFLGSIEHWAGKHALFARTHGSPNLYSIFLSNVYHAGLMNYIVPLPQTSLAAAAILAQLGITASMIHVDASHAYEDVLSDAAVFWPLLEPGGYLVGDDYHVTWPGVVRAAGEFSAKVGRPLSIDGPKWMLQKP